MRRRKPSSKKSPSEWQPSAKPEPKVYAKVHMGYMLVPPEHLEIMAQWVAIDYDYQNSTRNWKLKKSNEMHVEIVDREWLTALEVAQKLET